MQMFVQEPERKGSHRKLGRRFKVRAKVKWSLVMPCRYVGGVQAKLYSFVSLAVDTVSGLLHDPVT